MCLMVLLIVLLFLSPPPFLLSLTVKEKLTADPDSEIATTSLRVSLLCPVSLNFSKVALFAVAMPI